MTPEVIADESRPTETIDSHLHPGQILHLAALPVLPEGAGEIEDKGGDSEEEGDPLVVAVVDLRVDSLVVRTDTF